MKNDEWWKGAAGKAGLSNYLFANVYHFVRMSYDEYHLLLIFLLHERSDE